MRLLATVLFAGTLAVALPAAAQDADSIAHQFFPEQLTADSLLDQVRGGYVPRQLQATATQGQWVFAAYSDGYSGVVRVIERGANGPRVVADSTFRSMAGTAPGIQLLDLDSDNTPEVLASFADQYGTEQYWIYSWNGETLHLLSETENNPVTGIDSRITNPTFVDTDGDGTLEVIDQKATDEQDEEGELSGDAIYTVYSLRDGHLIPAPPAPLFQGFARGKGKPARVESEFSVERMGAYRLRMVNGDDASSAATSGNVWINGAAVLSPNDFKRSTRVVTRNVTLAAGSNTLAVQLQGEPRSHIWILVEPLP